MGRRRLAGVLIGVMVTLAAAASAGLFSVDILTKVFLNAPVASTAVSTQSYINQGKFHLTTHNILAARDQFKLAVQAEPANQEANLLYGVTRIAAVAESQQNPADTGFASVREIFELVGFVFSSFNIYGSGYTAPQQLAPSTPGTGEIQDFLKATLLTEVDGAIANLSVVNNTAFTSIINPVSFSKTTGVTLTIDYADVLVIKALVQALKCTLELIMVYGLDFDPPSILAAPEQFMTYKQFFQDPAFLTPIEPARLPSAKTAIINFIDTFDEASRYLAARSGSSRHLFVIDVPLTNEVVVSNTSSLNQFKQALAEVKASLSGQYHYSFVKGNIVRGKPQNTFVDLSRFFDAANPLNIRTKIDDIVNGVPNATTLNGLFPLGITGLEPFVATYGDDILGVTNNEIGTPHITVKPDSVSVFILKCTKSTI